MSLRICAGKHSARLGAAALASAARIVHRATAARPSLYRIHSAFVALKPRGIVGAAMVACAENSPIADAGFSVNVMSSAVNAPDEAGVTKGVAAKPGPK